MFVVICVEIRPLVDILDAPSFFAMDQKTHAIHTVEVSKRPGQGLGLFLREGNGVDRADGVFVSRFAPGSAAQRNDLLRVGDEILSVNSSPVAGRRLEDVVIAISIHRNLVLTLKTVTSSPDACPSVEKTTMASSPTISTMTSLAVPRPPVVVVKGGSRTYGSTSGRRSKSPERLRSPSDVTTTVVRRTERSGWSDRKSCPRSVSADFRRLEEITVPPETVCFFADGDSGDSGLSSDNSGFHWTLSGDPGKAKSTVISSCVSPVGSTDKRSVEDEAGSTTSFVHLNSDVGYHHQMTLRERGPRFPQTSMGSGQSDDISLV